jgi:hypothetical protein
MKQPTKTLDSGKRQVFVKGYTTEAGRIVPDHYRSIPYASDGPKGTFIERRLINPKQKRRIGF